METMILKPVILVDHRCEQQLRTGYPFLYVAFPLVSSQFVSYDEGLNSLDDFVVKII